jgi:FG-GAP-like repeat
MLHVDLAAPRSLQIDDQRTPQVPGDRGLSRAARSAQYAQVAACRCPTLRGSRLPRACADGCMSAKCQRVVICSTAHTDRGNRGETRRHLHRPEPVCGPAQARGGNDVRRVPAVAACQALIAAAELARGPVRAAALGGAGDVRHARRVGALAGTAAAVVLALPAGALAQVSFGAPTKISTGGGGTPTRRVRKGSQGDLIQMFTSNAAQVVGQSKARAGSGGGVSGAWRRAWRLGRTVRRGAAAGGAGAACGGARPPELRWTPTNYVVGNSPTSVAVGEFNGDSDPDLAVTNYASQTVSVLLGDTGGSFKAPASATPATVGDRPVSVAVGNFNGDSQPDLAVVNLGNPGSVAGSASVLLGQGNGSFTAASNPTALAMDPLKAQIRQVYFFDTPDLSLNQHGSCRAFLSTTGCQPRG